MNYEVRKLPKKTVVIISIIIILSFGIFFILQTLKTQKMSEILVTLGHKNIENLKVVNKLNVEDIQTRIKSSVYKIVFYDKDMQKKCMGFVHHEKDNSYTKDFDCK
ncbi:hypothetical protein ACN2EN_02020 [Aliarcobacter lanthieri]|uniref:hypothetical protein n=1 Tax=Aliarcobacter lanthieri TaxID=1355374 RepID=UPI00047E0175|nr:hypothetical protein [Aliarcobacter lanthieri]QKF58435.1 hypothetical protein ALANTH_0303 [Aliarcobacter lanthieri]